MRRGYAGIQVEEILSEKGRIVGCHGHSMYMYIGEERRFQEHSPILFFKGSSVNLALNAADNDCLFRNLMYLQIPLHLSSSFESLRLSCSRMSVAAQVLAATFRPPPLRVSHQYWLEIKRKVACNLQSSCPPYCK